MKRFVILILVLAFTSCAPVYVPNAINTPLFTEQHDASLQGSFGFNGYDVQAAYSPLKHFGIMANTGFYAVNDDSHSFFEGGIGYYGDFETNGRYEVYGGFGNGSTILNNNILADRVSANYNRIFIQPAIGAKMNVFEASFAPRISYVHLYDLRLDNITNTPTEALFIEPVVTAKVGYKYGKFFVQFGASLHTNDVLSIYSQPLIFNIGLNLSFSKLYLQKTSAN